MSILSRGSSRYATASYVATTLLPNLVPHATTRRFAFEAWIFACPACGVYESSSNSAALFSFAVFILIRREQRLDFAARRFRHRRCRAFRCLAEHQTLQLRRHLDRLRAVPGGVEFKLLQRLRPA